MSEVLVQMARSGWIKHKEGPGGFQSPVDVLQNLGWVSEVVDHVERCDELIVIPLFKPCCVLGLEANVIQSPKLCFCPGGGDGIVGEIVAHETAVREGLGHEVEHNPMPAPDVRGSDATLQAFDQPWNDGKRAVDEGSAVYLCAILRLDILETPECGVGHAATVAEALDDSFLDVAEQRNKLCDVGQVVGAGGAREAGGVLGR